MHLKDTFVEKYNIEGDIYDELIKKYIVSFISRPHIINATLPPSTEKCNVIFCKPDPDCSHYYFRKFNIIKFKFEYYPYRLIDLAKGLKWALHHHKMIHMRDSIIFSFQTTGYEAISTYNKDQLNLLTYNRDPKNQRFFKKFYECLLIGIRERTFELFKEARITEYEADIKESNGNLKWYLHRT